MHYFYHFDSKLSHFALSLTADISLVSKTTIWPCRP